MTYLADASIMSVRQQSRVNARTWLLVYVGILALAAFLGLVTMRYAPLMFPLPFAFLITAVTLTLIRPVFGVYIIAFFTFLTDGSITPWYPFAKNLSSRESMLYVSDALTISPLEVVLIVAVMVWALGLLVDPAARSFVRGRLFVPMMTFSGLLAMGFLYGIVTGGDRYAAVWEFRPFLYLPLVYVLVTNLFTNRRDYHRLAVVIAAALVGHAVLSLRRLSTLSAAQVERLESLVDHGSAVQMSVILLAALSAWLIPQVPRTTRRLLLLAAIPVGWVWLVSERRAAVIGLVVGAILVGLFLTQLSRRTLLIFAPIFLVLSSVYLAAFWKSDESTIGFPAQAIRSVVSGDEASAKDQSSNQYRIIENHDILYTIHSRPITGLGFGQKFYRPVPLPDISFFPFYEYIPHNSVLWIWIKAGVVGFLSMLYLFGSAIRAGVRSLMRLRAGRDAFLVTLAIGYVVMYLVFAYVDIAWDARSMILLPIAMAICGDLAWLRPAEVDDRPLESAVRSSVDVPINPQWEAVR
jgi:hypothetical protein